MVSLDFLYASLRAFKNWVYGQFDYLYGRFDYLISGLWDAIDDVKDEIYRRLDTVLGDIWSDVLSLFDTLEARFDYLLGDIWSELRDIVNKISILDSLDDIIDQRIEGYKTVISGWIEDKLLNIIWNVGQKEI